MVGELLVTTILPGGLQAVLYEKDTEEKQGGERIFIAGGQIEKAESNE